MEGVVTSIRSRAISRLQSVFREDLGRDRMLDLLKQCGRRGTAGMQIVESVLGRENGLDGLNVRAQRKRAIVRYLCGG